MDTLLIPAVLERLDWHYTKRPKSSPNMPNTSTLKVTGVKLWIYPTHSKAAVDPSQKKTVRANSGQPLKLTFSEGPQNGDQGSVLVWLPGACPS